MRERDWLDRLVGSAGRKRGFLQGLGRYVRPEEGRGSRKPVTRSDPRYEVAASKCGEGMVGGGQTREIEVPEYPRVGR